MTLFNGLISGIDLKTYQEEIDGILTRVTSAENSIITLNGQVFINIKGDWNALTNTPNLLTITKKQGDAYKVNIAGGTNLDGETEWKINDLAVYGTDNKWFKIDNTQFSEINDSVIALNTTYSSTKIDLLLNTKVDKITGKGLSTNDFDNTYKATLDNLTENVQDIMSTTLVDTSTIDFVYDDENNNITANIKDVSILNAKIAINADIETSKIKQTTITPVLSTFASGDTQDILNNKTQGQVNNLQEQINARPVGASNGSVYYLTSQDSTIPNYELLSFSPDASILDVESITVNVNTIKASRLIHSYISNYDIGATVVNGGVWSFNLYGYVSHLNNSNFEIDVLKRAGTVETVLFTIDTTRFLETTQISPDKNLVNGETYQQDFTCNATDRIVIKIYGKTDRMQDTIITLLHSGTDYASHVHTPLIATHNNLAGLQGGIINEKYHLSLTEYNNVQNLTTNLSSKQNNIIKVNNQTEMLGLSTAIVGDIVIRVDDNNYQYRLNALPASNLSNWEVLGKNATSVGETVDDIITTNEVITSKPNGLYAFAGIPNGGLPSGVLQGDIALKTGTTYTIAYTFVNAPSTIFSKSDNKIYKKTVNGSGLNTWEKIPETTLYEVGAGKGYVTLQSAVDTYRTDFLASKVVVGNILIYDSVINESVTIANDIQNLLIEGFGVSTRGNTQIQSITLYGHRVTFKNIQVNAFIVNSTGTISEYGVTTKRGKHIFDGVVFANNTTAIDVQGINNFLNFKDCDFNSKPIAIANNPSASPLDMTTISIDSCTNGLLNCGTNRLITKNNSLSIYQGTITGTILDVDGAKPIAYSILRSYSALGLSIPVALKTLIINDDVGGTLQLLKCTTAYIIAGAAGIGTAIDLTKYQIQTDNNKVSSTETITVDGDLVVFSGTSGKIIKKTTTNTAFNKNFGTTTGTVCEGNDARLGTKAIDEQNIANNKILVYNSITQKLEYQDKPIGATNLSVANKTTTTLDIVSDTGNDATIPSSTTTEAGLMSSTDKIKLNAITGTNTGDETATTIYTKIKSNIIAGTNITIDKNDVTNTFTINSSGGGGSGTFNPIITNQQDGQTLVYDVTIGNYVNGFSITRPVINVDLSLVVSVISTFDSPFNIGVQDAVQYRLYSDITLTTLILDTGVLPAGSTYAFTGLTPDTTYYAIGRVRGSKYQNWSSWSNYSSFTPAAFAIYNAIGVYSGLLADTNPTQDNPNTYNPSTGFYGSNGANWTLAQRVQLINNSGENMGIQTLANGTSYTFTIHEALITASTGANCMRIDLGVSRAINGFVYYTHDNLTPGGWGSPLYINGTLFEYSTNGTSWSTLTTIPSDFSVGNVPSIYNGIVNAVARYIRVRASFSTYNIVGRFQAYSGTCDLIAYILTTSLGAYNTALSNTAVEITALEYTKLSAIYGVNTAGVTTAVLNSDANTSIIYPAGFTKGAYSLYSTIPSGKTPFAFAVNLAPTSGVLQIKSGPSTGGNLTNLHSNIVNYGGGMKYYVIKTPAYTQTGFPGSPYLYDTVGGYGSINGSYQYYYNNTAGNQSNAIQVTSNSLLRIQVLSK